MTLRWTFMYSMPDAPVYKNKDRYLTLADFHMDLVISVNHLVFWKLPPTCCLSLPSPPLPLPLSVFFVSVWVCYLLTSQHVFINYLIQTKHRVVEGVSGSWGFKRSQTKPLCVYQASVCQATLMFSFFSHFSSVSSSFITINSLQI